MTLSIQLPQCFICFNLFNADTELVRPSKCNHIFCRPCAEDRFSRTDMCAVCRLTCKERELVSVFVAHGTYDARALIEDAHYNEDLLVDVIMSENKRSFLTRSKRSIQLLDDLATSDPLEWRMPRSGRGNDRGLVFASVGRVMRDVGDSVEGNDEIRDVLHRLSEVITKLQTTYQKAVDVSTKYRNLESQNKALEGSRSCKEISLQQSLHRCSEELDRERLERTRREDDLIGKMSELKRNLMEAQQGRKEAESALSKVEKDRKAWIKKSGANKKKYEVKRQELEEVKRSMKMRQICEDEVSDSSLEIEGKNTHTLDEEDEPPLPVFPSSSAFSLLQNVPDSNAPEAPSLQQLVGDHSMHNLDTQGYPTTLSRSVERVLSKLHSVHPNRDHLRFPGKPVLSGSPLAPTSRRENVDLRASSSSRPAVPATNLTTNLLQSTSPNPKKGSKVKDGLPAKSTRRQANGAGVPANPLARRQDTHSLREREKKRQRLTLGEGDG